MCTDSPNRLTLKRSPPAVALALALAPHRTPKDANISCLLVDPEELPPPQDCQVKRAADVGAAHRGSPSHSPSPSPS